MAMGESKLFIDIHNAGLSYRCEMPQGLLVTQLCTGRWRRPPRASRGM